MINFFMSKTLLYFHKFNVQPCLPHPTFQKVRRLGTKELIHFIGLAYGSLMETMNQLILADDLGYIPKDTMIWLRCNVAGISKNA